MILFIFQIFATLDRLFRQNQPVQPVQQPVAQPVQQPLSTTPRTYTPAIGMTLLPTDVIPVQMIVPVVRNTWRLVFGN